MQFIFFIVMFSDNKLKNIVQMKNVYFMKVIEFFLPKSLKI